MKGLSLGLAGALQKCSACLLHDGFSNARDDKSTLQMNVFWFPEMRTPQECAKTQHFQEAFLEW